MQVLSCGCVELHVLEFEGGAVLVIAILFSGVDVFAWAEQEEETDVAEVPDGVELPLAPSLGLGQVWELEQDAWGDWPQARLIRVQTLEGLEQVLESGDQCVSPFSFAWVLVNQPFDLRSNGQKGCRHCARSDGLTAGGKDSISNHECIHLEVLLGGLSALEVIGNVVFAAMLHPNFPMGVAAGSGCRNDMFSSEFLWHSMHNYRVVRLAYSPCLVLWIIGVEVGEQV